MAVSPNEVQRNIDTTAVKPPSKYVFEPGNFGPAVPDRNPIDRGEKVVFYHPSTRKDRDFRQ